MLEHGTAAVQTGHVAGNREQSHRDCRSQRLDEGGALPLWTAPVTVIGVGAVQRRPVPQRGKEEHDGELNRVSKKATIVDPSSHKVLGKPLHDVVLSR